LKCGAGEGWRRSIGTIKWEIKYYLRVKQQRNILHEISKQRTNWIGHILRRNCLLQQVIEGNIKTGIEITVRRGRRRRKLLDELKERRGYSHLKEEALDHTMWRARCGRGFGPVMRRAAGWVQVHFSSLLWLISQTWNTAVKYIAIGTIAIRLNVRHTLLTEPCSLYLLEYEVLTDVRHSFVKYKV
jgi:hypothetical protein